MPFMFNAVRFPAMLSIALFVAAPVPTDTTALLPVLVIDPVRLSLSSVVADPPLIVVAPVYVFAPLKVRVPEPPVVRASVPAPLLMALLTVVLPAPLIVSVLVPVCAVEIPPAKFRLFVALLLVIVNDWAPAVLPRPRIALKSS